MPANSYHVVVIGAGTGGSGAAITAARLGQWAAIVGKRRQLAARGSQNRTIHAQPTLLEAVGEAAHAVHGVARHS